MRFVLLDPNCPEVANWDLRGLSRVEKRDIERVLSNFRELAPYVQQENQLDIRLLPTFPPYSIISVDPDRNSGWMIIEFYDYKRSIGERGHLFIRKETNLYWHSHFISVLDQIYSDAAVWQDN